MYTHFWMRDGAGAGETYVPLNERALKTQFNKGALNGRIDYRICDWGQGDRSFKIYDFYTREVLQEVPVPKDWHQCGILAEFRA